MELDDQLSDSYASDDTSESDFEFNFDELELSDDDSNVYPEKLNSMNESSFTDSGFTSIFLKELTPVSVFRKVFDREILKLITDETNIYEKGKKRSNNQKKINWKDVSKKEIELFLGLVILMDISNLSNMKLYGSSDMVFQNTFISSIISRNRFSKFFIIYIWLTTHSNRKEDSDESTVKYTKLKFY